MHFFDHLYVIFICMCICTSIFFAHIRFYIQVWMHMYLKYVKIIDVHVPTQANLALKREPWIPILKSMTEMASCYSVIVWSEGRFGQFQLYKFLFWKPIPELGKMCISPISSNLKFPGWNDTKKDQQVRRSIDWCIVRGTQHMLEDVFLGCFVFFWKGSSDVSRCIAKIFQTLELRGVFHYCRSRSMKFTVFALPLGPLTAVPNIGLFRSFWINK